MLLDIVIVNGREDAYLGFDEAGRGCVIGPLVLGMVMSTRSQMRQLKSIGVKDSKQLSPDARGDLHGPITQHILAHGYTVLEAEMVGDARHNINHLEMDAMAMWIRQIRPKAVYVDVPAPPGRGLENFCQALAWQSGIARSRILGANKADQRFPIVSAASIIAKLHRDALVESMKQETGDFGSGYPSDPKTRSYLQGLLKDPGSVLPGWVRAKWGTTRQLLAASQQASLF